MELDKRIIEGKRPLTCFDLNEAEEYVGKKCYISNEYDFFRNLDFTQQKILNGVEDCEVPFHYDTGNRSEFCLPCEWVKQEPKYRPYNNAQELFEDIGVYIGDTIHFRSKSKQTEHHALITSYSTPKDGVETLSFGGFIYRYTMPELFDLFELHSRGEWKPFGIKE